jgi:hypothetical protein
MSRVYVCVCVCVSLSLCMCTDVINNNKPQEGEVDDDVFSMVLADQRNPLAALFQRAAYEPNESSSNTDDNAATASLAATLLFSEVQRSLEQSSGLAAGHITQTDLLLRTLQLTWTCLLWPSSPSNTSLPHRRQWPWVHHIASFATLLDRTNQILCDPMTKDNAITSDSRRNANSQFNTQSDGLAVNTSIPCIPCIPSSGEIPRDSQAMEDHPKTPMNLRATSQRESWTSAFKVVVTSIVNAQPVFTSQACDAEVGSRIVWVLASALGMQSDQQGSTSNGVDVATGVINLIGQQLLNSNVNTNNNTVTPVLLDALVRVSACVPQVSDVAQSLLMKLAQRPDLGTVARDHGRTTYERLYALGDPVVGHALRANLLAHQTMSPPPLNPNVVPTSALLAQGMYRSCMNCVCFCFCSQSTFCQIRLHTYIHTYSEYIHT